MPLDEHLQTEDLPAMIAQLAGNLAHVASEGFLGGSDSPVLMEMAASLTVVRDTLSDIIERYIEELGS